MSNYRTRNSTADRVLTILQLFSTERTEVTAIDVAEALGVARSTAYRYLQTLVQTNFLAESGRGGFRLGLKIIELAHIARSGSRLSDVAVPVMRDLAERFHQTVLLTKQSGAAVVCLEREESSSQYVRLSYARGSVLGLNAGASALVLLAWQKEEHARTLLNEAPLTAFTDKTLTDPNEIMEKLRLTRQNGFCITHDDVDSGATGIAVPIFGESQDVIAAISVVIIRARMNSAEIDEITEAVIAAARQISNGARFVSS